MRLILLLGLLTFITYFNPTFSQTGKISGTITDAANGDPLIGANIIIEGTSIGAATNIDGYYSFINIQPGVYSLRVSMIGYTPSNIQDVRVNINLTTELNVQLREQTFETEEVIVIAEAPIVKQDISASVVNLNIEEIQNLPVSSINSVVGLQAGIIGGQIRGGAADQTAWVLNGVTLRDERTNEPYTNISFTSVEQVQVQTGGFNAEYGNLRSGLVNVVTKEGSKDRYSFSFIGRYSGASQKHFGDSPHSTNSYWIRPYIDPDVAWTGTKSGTWDTYTQKQYQEFRGWNKVSEELLNDSDPSNDLTPDAAQKLFLWQHRRSIDIEKPDYDVDMSLSGPVPGGRQLGNLRFAASLRDVREMYYIPLSRDAYREYNYQLKVTSDIAQGMKLSLEGLLGQQSGTGSSRSGGPGIFRSPGSIADDIDIRAGASFLDSRVFATDYWAPSTIDFNMLGAKFTHVLNSQTFYEVIISRVGSEYETNPGTARDARKIYQFGDNFYDEAPFGVYSGTSSGIGSSMNMGLGFSNSRDSSKLVTTTAKIDLASQVDKYNYIKTGFEFIYTDNNVNYALIEPTLPTNNARSVWRTFPIKGAFYIQDKLEFEGMIANLGIRIDYSNPGGEWYVLDPFDRSLSGAQVGNFDEVDKVSVDEQLYISPRLGVAFPISLDSKLFFNYGHSRDLPIPDQLFLLRRNLSSQKIDRIANPNNPLQRTIQYELGYEHNLFDQFLARLAGYYKDISDEPRLIEYINRDNSVSYFIPEPNRYQDTRGFEITISKNRGEWIRGFVNYTYEVTSSGFFGLVRYYENPALQRDVVRNTAAFRQTKPVPRPFARANIDFVTPVDFGPKLGGIHILGDWIINLLATYRAGTYFSWTGRGGVKEGYPNNIQWADNYNLNMRLSKGFEFGLLKMEFFMDINNLLNIKYMDYRAGFIDLNDWDDYMTSLHLPDEIAGQFKYGNIPGNDRPGDIRTGHYIPWDENASEAQKDEWRKNKSYIDMPNLTYTAFLNPRDIFWGFRLSVSL